MGDPKKPLHVSLSVLIQLVIVLLIFPLLPILITWRWNWWQAWVYYVLLVLAFILSRYLANRRHPDILQERASYMEHQDTQSWDKLLSPLTAFSSVFIVLVAGLDRRFGWSGDFSLLLNWIGIFLLAGGYALSSYALIANRFFSGTVRLQEERGHHPVSDGPYRWMRHPGYSGSLLSSIGIPLLLGSAWAFLMVGVALVILVTRTRLEDRFLQDNLPGYQEYARRVRFRLLPGIW